MKIIFFFYIYFLQFYLFIYLFIYLFLYPSLVYTVLGVFLLRRSKRLLQNLPFYKLLTIRVKQVQKFQIMFITSMQFDGYLV